MLWKTSFNKTAKVLQIRIKRVLYLLFGSLNKINSILFKIENPYDVFVAIKPKRKKSRKLQ
jgi:hypothetical protein